LHIPSSKSFYKTLLFLIFKPSFIQRLYLGSACCVTAAAHVSMATIPGTAVSSSAYYSSPYGVPVSTMSGVPDPYAQPGMVPPPNSVQLGAAPAGQPHLAPAAPVPGMM